MAESVGVKGTFPPIHSKPCLGDWRYKLFWQGNIFSGSTFDQSLWSWGSSYVFMHIDNHCKKISMKAIKMARWRSPVQNEPSVLATCPGHSVVNAIASTRATPPCWPRQWYLSCCQTATDAPHFCAAPPWPAATVAVLFAILQSILAQARCAEIGANTSDTQSWDNVTNMAIFSFGIRRQFKSTSNHCFTTSALIWRKYIFQYSN